MDKITVAQIKGHNKQIDKLRETRDLARDKHNEEIHLLNYDVYREQIRAIERERESEILKITQEREASIATFNSQIEKQAQLVSKANRTIEFLKLDALQNLAIPDEDIELSQYAEPYQEALGYLYDDDYLKAKAFIIGNRKPKNKYSLVIVGKSIFSKSIIKYPYSYGIDINNWGRYFALQIIIKDASSIADLKSYYIKHQATILKETITEYESVKTEYVEAKQTYSTDDFAELITWQCPQCPKFYTIFDSFANQYTPQCFRHDPYIDMVNQELNDIRFN